MVGSPHDETYRERKRWLRRESGMRGHQHSRRKNEEKKGKKNKKNPLVT